MFLLCPIQRLSGGISFRSKSNSQRPSSSSWRSSRKRRAQYGGTLKPVLIRLDRFKASRAAPVDLETQLFPTCVQQPELANARLKVGRRKAACVSRHRRVAHDLGHQVRSPLQLDVPPRLAGSFGNQTYSAAADRFAENEDNIRLGGQVRFGAGHANAVRKETGAADGFGYRKQTANDFHLQGPVYEQLFRRHVHLDPARDVVDATLLGSLVGQTHRRKSVRLCNVNGISTLPSITSVVAI